MECSHVTLQVIGLKIQKTSGHLVKSNLDFTSVLELYSGPFLRLRTGYGVNIGMKIRAWESRIDTQICVYKYQSVENLISLFG